jgi:hypothetical protein
VDVSKHIPHFQYEQMLTRSLAIFLSLLHLVCASPGWAQPEPLNSDVDTAVNSEACTYLSDHFATDGTRQEAGHYCTPFLRVGVPVSSAVAVSAVDVLNSPGCTFVPVYTKQDGSIVGPFLRCASSKDADTYKAAGTLSQPAPCVTSYCGSVRVKGYYQKDGTFVRPHTRKK